VADEGGQNLVGAGGGENNDAMTKLFHAANRHPRRGAVCVKYLRRPGSSRSAPGPSRPPFPRAR
jgi:hypothetical protein